MTLTAIVKLVVQFISWSENYLADFHDWTATWVRFFTDYTFAHVGAMYKWTWDFSAWARHVLDQEWTSWVEPAITATKDGLAVWSNFSAFVFGPLQGVIHTFLTGGVAGLLSILGGQTVGLDLVYAALLNASSAVIPWVKAAEDFVRGGHLNAYTAHEVSRAKLNALVAWANHYFLPSGLLRDVPLMESLLAHSPAAVSVIVGTGSTGDEADAFAEITKTYPPKTPTEALDLVPSWVAGPAPVIDDAIARFVRLAGTT